MNVCLCVCVRVPLSVLVRLAVFVVARAFLSSFLIRFQFIRLLAYLFAY